MHGWIGPLGLMEVPLDLPFRCQGDKRSSAKGRVKKDVRDCIDF